MAERSVALTAPWAPGHVQLLLPAVTHVQTKAYWLPKTDNQNHTYEIGPSKLPSANCLTMGSSVVSNSSTLPSHTTVPL